MLQFVMPIWYSVIVHTFSSILSYMSPPNRHYSNCWVIWECNRNDINMVGYAVFSTLSLPNPSSTSLS